MNGRACLFAVLVTTACSIERQIEMVRPGAEYTLTRGDYLGIQWADKKQTKPTAMELDQALALCQEEGLPKPDPNAGAWLIRKAIVVNPLALPGARLDALANILGLDK